MVLQLYIILYIKGQVALEGNFGFVQDKSDLKSASGKKIVRKATVAQNMSLQSHKICEQNITPCCERHAISCETAFTRCFHPQTATRGISKCSRLTKMYGAKKFGMIPALSRLR